MTKEISNQKDLIKQYEDACESIALFFSRKYFGSVLYDWVAGDIGGMCVINDYFFNTETMLDYMKYRYTPKQMFEHYEKDLDAHKDGKFIPNIKHWKKLNYPVKRKA